MLLSAETSASAPVSTRVYGETPTGVINGFNTVYTTAVDFVAGSEAVYFNGVRQTEGVGCDYVRSESGGVGTGFDTITLAVAPRNRAGAKPDDKVMIDYDPV